MATLASQAREDGTSSGEAQKDVNDIEDFGDSCETVEEVLERIAGRHESGEFPAVLPVEQQSRSESSAKDVLQWVTEGNVVQAQSFLDARYDKHRRDLPCIIKDSERLCRARWDRDFYYVLLEEFQASHWDRSILRSAVTSAVGRLNLAENDLARLDNMLQAISFCRAESFCEYVQSRLEEQRRDGEHLEGNDVEEDACVWFGKNWVKIVAEFIWTPRALKVPLYPEELDCMEDVDTARVEQRHVVRIEKAVEEACSGATEQLPMFARASFRRTGFRDFLRDRYYSIVGKVVAEGNVSVLAGAGSGEESFVFTPAVNAETCEQAKERREAIASPASPGQRRAISPAVQSMLQFPSDTTVDPFCSPKRRRVQGDSIQTEGSSVSFRSVEQLHTQASGRKTAFGLDAYLLHVPEEVRWTEVPVRTPKSAGKDARSKAAEKETVPVVTALLADRSGAIRIDFWRKAAEEYVRKCRQWLQDSDVPVLVRVECFQVSPENRSAECPMHKLHSVDGTTLCRVDTSVQESVCNTSIGVSSSLYVSDFTKLTRRPPFCINLHGIVTTVEAEVLSLNDNPMKAFCLQDGTGRWVRCTAHGRHVDNPALAKGNEVVLFFSTALAGLGSKAGQVWVYDDAHIFHTRSSCLFPEPRQEILIE